MKHIVLLAGSYYPYFSAVGKCLYNIAAAFEKDYKVTVICEKNRVDQTEHDAVDKQTMIRVTTKMHYNRLQIDEKNKTARGLGKYYWKSRLLLAKLERFLKSAFSKSACDPRLIRAYLEGFEKINEPVDVIIPTCNQFETVAAALQYKEQNPKVQIIPYLFDLFAESISINRGRLFMKLHWKANMDYERRMFEESLCVFHVENWSRHIKQYFPEYQSKAFEVEHPLLVCKPDTTPESDDGKIHIVYTGVVDRAIRNPEDTLALLSKLNCGNVVFDFYSFGSAESIVERFADQNKAIVAHGQVDSGTAEAARQRANMLLSIGNTGKTSQMPSKIIEYIANGKPIIHFASNAGDSAVGLLRQYPLAKVVDLSAEVDLKELEAYIKEKSADVLSPDEIKEIFQNADPEYIAKKIADQFEQA